MNKLPGRKPRLSAWDKAAACGVDMSLIESNLRRTPEQRLRAHDRAMNMALSLRKAMEARRARA